MNKYSDNTQKEVGKALHKFKQGQLKSGPAGKKVTSRKQALAIGLSNARNKHYKVPKQDKEDE